jgi:serine/threonine protein phosphatase PrpC
VRLCSSVEEIATSTLNERTLLLVLGAVAVLLLFLLLFVTVALLRAIRQKNAIAEGKTPAAGPEKVAKNTKGSRKPPAPAVLPKGPDALDEQPEEEIDVTRMTPFALVPSDALPKLSSRDEAEESDDEPTLANESQALLHFEGDSGLDVDEPTGPVALIQTAAAGQSDRGVTRRRNEDSYLVEPNLGLYVIADGMGAYAGGEIASRLAVDEVRTALRDQKPSSGSSDRPRRGREVIAAIERANSIIWRESRKDKAFEGMGTTVLVVRVSVRKPRVYIGHVGDSRCYRLRNTELKLLTTDHTLAARGVKGPLANNIRRAVGVASTVKVDLIVDKPTPEDVYLLCSDGLNKMISDNEIRELLSKESNLDRAVASLILAANARGGRDNISVILVRIRALSAGQGTRRKEGVAAKTA